MDKLDQPVALVIDPPGGVAPTLPEPVDGIGADTLAKISHEYIHTDKKVDSIAIDLGLSTKEVRTAIKRFGLDKKKSEIIQQVQQEELAAYSKFLLDHRVDTAAQHLRISNQINDAVESVLKTAAEKTPEELAACVKPLKDVASLFRSLSETLSASSGVGARAVALTGLAGDQGGGLTLANVGGKKPLVSLSFNVSAPDQGPKRVGETLEGELL